MRPSHGRSPAGAMALGVAATIVYTLPLFLLGALAVEITDELAFGSAGLGLAVAMNRASAAAVSPAFGRLADRFGATRSLRVSAVIATIASLGIATTAHHLITLVLWVIVLGIAAAIGLPATNRMLSNVVQPARLGVAFGIKQSAQPTATMLAGLSVPIFAVSLGWRSAYFVSAGLALIVVLAAGNQPSRAPQRRPVRAGSLVHPRPIRFLALAFGLSASSSSAVTTFYVDAAVAAGSSQRVAGTTFAVASLVTVGVRVVAGWVSDRRGGGHLQLCAGLIVVGSVGSAMLAVGSPPMLAAGAIVALAGTWGIAGVFYFAIVRAYPDTPGKVTGMVFPGSLLGGTIGPILFGLVAESSSYRLAWLLASCVGLLASAMMLHGARLLNTAVTSDS